MSYSAETWNHAQFQPTAQPPSDENLRNVIDKLAQFVGRNGPAFEKMTMEKQRDNEKFAFLFPNHPFHGYYRQMVNAAASHQSAPSAPGFPGPSKGWKMEALNPTNGNREAFRAQGPQASNTDRVIGEWQSKLDSLKTLLSEAQQSLQQCKKQQEVLRGQIIESEFNLNAQMKVSSRMELEKTAGVILLCRNKYLQDLSQHTQIDLSTIEKITDSVVESCTKESISAGKTWIFERAINHHSNQLIANYIANRVTSTHISEFIVNPDNMTKDIKLFTTKLHLIYLVNDILHHCDRKKAEELKQSLESVVVEMFCSAMIYADQVLRDPSRQAKLTKLISIWRDKNIFGGPTIRKLENTTESWSLFIIQLKQVYAEQIQAEVYALRKQLESYQQQHNEFKSHANDNIAAIDKSCSEFEAKIEQCQKDIANAETKVAELEANRSRHFAPGPFDTTDPSAATSDNNMPPPLMSQTPFGSGHEPRMPDMNFPPPGFMPSQFPPMGNATSLGPSEGLVGPFGFLPSEASLVPSMPYYELPVGLMVPLIAMDQCEYRPINDKKLRLPPPTPASDELMAAIQSFYDAPSHANPRDADGWEKTGLYEWFRQKSMAIKDKQLQVESGERKVTPPSSPEESFSDIEEGSVEENKKTGNDEPKHSVASKGSAADDGANLVENIRRKLPFEGRVFRETPPSSQASSPSSSPRASRSRRRHRRSDSTGTLSDKGSSGSRSPSPPSREHRYRRHRERRRDSPPQRRRASPSPPRPSFGMVNVEQRLSEGNKGHQMMQRMGWKAGSGLGASESGIVEPIRGGEIRDKNDQYRGVGSAEDAFDTYRKSRSGWFNTRMKSRGDDRRGSDV